MGIIAFLSLFTFLLDALVPQRELSLGIFTRSVIVSAPFAILIALVDYQLVRFVNHSTWFITHIVPRILFEASALIVLALATVLLGNIPFWTEGETFSGYFSSQRFYIPAVASVLVNAFMVTIFEYFHQIRRNDKLQQENLEMQYMQLKNQINPHFLFNSLNVLVSLINKDTHQAVDYTQKLSEIYRYVLTHDSKKLTYVTDELQFIAVYVEALRIRYGDAFKCVIDVDDRGKMRLIPPMSLQLLVENAVKHNAITKRNPLVIHIEREGSYLVVSNNVIKRTRVVASTGVGLENLDRKYEILSSKEIVIKYSEKNFIVKLPLL